MASSSPSAVRPPSELKREGGKWLRALRERRGLSQKQLAALVGVQNSVFISQLENGRVRIPPERYDVWAEAYGLPSYEFVKALMSFYDPITHRLLFGDNAAVEDLNLTGELSKDTAIISGHVNDRYIDALYLLLGRKTAELEILQETLASAQSSQLKNF